MWAEAIPWSHLLDLIRNLPFICFRAPQMNVLVFLLRILRAARKSEVLKGRIGDVEEAVGKVSQLSAAVCCESGHESPSWPMSH